MNKIVCIESYSYYPLTYDDVPPLEISIEEGKLYYAVDSLVKTTEVKYYNIYDFDTANYIGLFKGEYFGPYELWIAQQRDIKINEILNG